MTSTLNDDPMAVTSRGRLLASVTHVGGERSDPGKALERALASGRRVFIGVELTPAQTTVALGRLDGALAEIVAFVPYRDRG